ncbi:hypothetical protein SAMN05444724_2194 [Salinivibrio sp. ES.052]|nr:hypothetical protein SAMN05444724_2194 [Salinivibrio sp. ES.052]
MSVLFLYLLSAVRAVLPFTFCFLRICRGMMPFCQLKGAPSD